MSKRKYKIVGFENGNYFNLITTIGQLLSNSNNDTLFKICILDLKINETICIKSSRDSLFGSDAVVCRVS